MGLSRSLVLLVSARRLRAATLVVHLQVGEATVRSAFRSGSVAAPGWMLGSSGDVRSFAQKYLSANEGRNLDRINTMVRKRLSSAGIQKYRKTSQN